MVDGGVLNDGEFVAIEDGEKAGDDFLFALLVAIDIGEIDALAFAGEEEVVGDGWAFLGIAGESVEVGGFLGFLVTAVEAFEESTIEERDVGKVGECFFGWAREVGFVTIKIIEVVSG